MYSFLDKYPLLGCGQKLKIIKDACTIPRTAPAALEVEKASSTQSSAALKS
jgi:hypothetical protein